MRRLCDDLRILRGPLPISDRHNYSYQWEYGLLPRLHSRATAPIWPRCWIRLSRRSSSTPQRVLGTVDVQPNPRRKTLADDCDPRRHDIFLSSSAVPMSAHASVTQACHSHLSLPSSLAIRRRWSHDKSRDGDPSTAAHRTQRNVHQTLQLFSKKQLCFL